jgi:3-hydroxyacyl-CoA dehydrogenase
MKKRNIAKVAVLGSGIMGSGIACHFANIGCEVLLLDIVPKDTPENAPRSERNKIVNDSLQKAIKSNPSPIYKKSFANRITTGNFDDNLKDIEQCDWIIEVVIERLDIKKIVFEKVEKYRKPGTLITSNTSGIPIQLMTEGRSDDFKAHFCGTHFFNPPRYLKLLEIIPTPFTKPEIVEFLMHYGELFLGKTTVLCKDTPAFIANRIGVYSIMALFHAVNELNLTVEEVDKLTGPVLGRPKSATFRTGDLVGLDTLIHVADGVRTNCPNDEENDSFQLPHFLVKMKENNWLGDKTGQGFYKKTKNEKGEKTILSLNLKTLEYEAQKKVKFPALEMVKPVDDLKQRTKMLVQGNDKAAEFYKKMFAKTFAYCANRIPEISDEIYKIDDAMKAGFGWELGPFEMWDAVGVSKGLELIEAEKLTIANWIKDFQSKGNTSFYTINSGIKKYYNHATCKYETIPGTEQFISLEVIRPSKTIWKNAGTTLTDIGDGILNLEFHTKMNSIGGEVLAGINKAIDIAEAEYKGLVISNEGANFSAGANVGMIFMMAAEQDYDEIDLSVRYFQNTVMRLRYSYIPVVVAPYNLTLGGACEMCLHADAVVAHAESYIGLVEFGVGLIPGGGGSKEFAVRLSDELKEGDIESNQFRNRFLTIGQAKVSTSAYEAFDLGYLQKGKDKVVVSRSRHLAEAKAECLRLANAGYTKPAPRKDIRVFGKQALGLVYVGAHSMMSGNFISTHDQKISEKLGYVLAGGDLSEPQTVSEQYLLDLERKAFVELCAERKTLERMQSLLTSGKILRN